MYDELVKSLHEGAEFLECSTPGIKNSFAKMCHNAADAIAELSRDLDSMNEANIALHGALPKWIPVTERLPESVYEYVLCCGEKGGQFVGWVGTGRIVNGKARAFQHGGRGRNITHWMPLPEPPKEK